MIYPWNRVPETVRDDLLTGSSGWRSLLDLAVRVFERAEKPCEHQAFLIELGSGLLRAAWEEDPFALHLVNQLLAVDQALNHLDGPTRGLLQFIRQNTALPEDGEAADLEAATGSYDYDRLTAIIDQGFKRQPGNLFWLYLGLRSCAGTGRFGWLERHLAAQSTLPQALKLGLTADLALLRGDAETAGALYGEALQDFASSLWMERRGHALLRQGRPDAAVAAWDEALSIRPWHVQLWLARDTVRKGLHNPGDFPGGPGVVLLFTWNGRDKINQTLSALAGAEWPDEAAILVADNGSDDGKTPAILAAWQQRFAGRLRVVTLPCNIGAPAARNWLMTEPEARAASWLAYLDDDVIVPPDWLRHFGTIMRAMPDHGVYGCGVLRHQRPWCFQGADMHLLPPSEAAGPGMPRAPVHMQAANRAEEQFDFGQFDYSRACVHVSGCCHIFRREHLDRAGLFDVRFSPSQVDDFEHDIRMFSQGDAPVYHGSLKIRHMHATGLTTARDLPKAMNAFANHLKLQSLYPRPQFDALRERNMAMLLQDCVRRQR